MTTESKKRVAIYTRVSTDLQDHELQLRELRLYAMAREFEVVREYRDVASGAKESRPDLDTLMAEARRRVFDVVLVWKFDRFARSTSHLIRVLEEFQGLGVGFISITESIDTTTPMGKFVFPVIGAMAEFERDLIRERVRAGIRTARANGKVIGPPRVRVDLDEVKRMQAEGVSLRTIARKVEAWRNGKKIHPSPSLLCGLLRQEREAKADPVQQPRAGS